MKTLFELHKQDTHSQARLGTLHLAHGDVPTPVFMPVGTRGAVKTLTSSHLEDLGARLILANTYHMHLRPGESIVEKAGGLHDFCNWKGNFLTDSGGFQVFSLADLRKITEEGVSFSSHIDGSRVFIGPKESMRIQKALGADIVMAFDECLTAKASFEDNLQALERTTRWAAVCRESPLNSHQNLFGIIQGGMSAELRRRSAREICSLDCEGFAIGGLSVGEPAETMYSILDVTTPLLPFERPRYLMGVGTPRNIIESVRRGIDMFDCVMPTRNARNGTVFTWSGKINIKSEKYKEDFRPLDEELDCYASRFSRAYLRHLFNVGEMTGLTLLTIQNIAFYLDLMKKIRESIQAGSFMELYAKVCELYS